MRGEDRKSRQRRGKDYYILHGNHGNNYRADRQTVFERKGGSERYREREGRDNGRGRERKPRGVK